MNDKDWRTEAARSSLARLLPRLKAQHAPNTSEIAVEWHQFQDRLDQHWERLFGCLHELYGWQYDFFYTLEQVLRLLILYWLDRPQDLHRLDQQREASPD